MDDGPGEISRRRLLWLGGAGLAAMVPVTSTATAAPTARAMLCRDAWGAAPPRGPGRPQVPSRMTIHHTAWSLATTQRARPTAPAPALPPGHAGVDRHRLSPQRRPQREHLPAARSSISLATPRQATTRPAISLSSARGTSTKKQVTEEQLDGAALAFAWAAATIRYPDRHADGSPRRIPRHHLPGREPLRPRHVGRPPAPGRRLPGRRPRRPRRDVWP